MLSRRIARIITVFIVCYSILLSSFIFADDIPSYTEIPYYLKQLEQTDLEDKRLESLKKIHDAVVNANLLDKKTVKEMTPMIEKIVRLMDSNLDRPFIDGESSYLQSAVDYFERQKLKSLVEIPESDWMELQSKIGKDYQLSTYPDKVLLHAYGKSEVIAQNKGIHEAVLSRDAKKIAYYRVVEEASDKAELWVVQVPKKKQKKIASVPSCYTLLFSADGGEIYYQEKPKKPGTESTIFKISTSGGKPRPIAKGTLLQTLVAKGRYEGDLVVYKLTAHHWGSTEQECPYAFSSSGKEIGRIKNAACK